MGTFDDLHGGVTVHVRQLHQNAAGLVGVALCQQGGVGNAGPNIDTVCFAAAEGQASVHGNTTGKGTVFRLGRIPSENRQAVIPKGAMALASFKDCVFYGKRGSRDRLAPHLHRRRGFGGVRVLDRTVLNGHILGKDYENRLIGPAAQRMAVQLQRDTLFDFYGSALHIIVSTKGNGVPFLGGCQRRFQTGVELLSNGEGIDKSAAVGAVAVFVRGALVVAAAAAVALTAHILACVRHHLDFALEIFRIGGIHNALVIPEGIAIVQQLQGPVDAITVQPLFEVSALQVGGAVEGNRQLKARVLSPYGQLKLGANERILIVNILQNQLSAGNGANFSQGAVFHGEGAIGEISHLQALHRVLLQVQGHVLAPCLVVACVHVSGQHVLRQVDGSAACQETAYLSRAGLGSIHGVVCAALGHQKGLRAARFSALLAGAVVICFSMLTGVDRQGDGGGIDTVAATGQGAVDLGGMQPGLVGHLGQLATHEKILKEKFVPGAVIQLRAVLQLPLVGNVPGQAGGQFGSHLDFLVALPGIQIPALAADGGILGLGGDGDGPTENGDGDGLGDLGSVGAGGSNGQAVSALLHGCIRCHRQSLAVVGEALRQAGVVSHPLGFQGGHIHFLGGNGKGGRLIGSALIEVALLGLHREHGAGDFADVVSLLLGVIQNIVDISGIHFLHRCVLLVGSQNGQIAGIARIPGSHFDAAITAGGVEGTAKCIQIGADNTGIRVAVGLQLAALQFHRTNGYGVILAPAGLNGTARKGQSSAFGVTVVGAVKDGAVAHPGIAPAVADDRQGAGALDGQLAVVQIQRCVALDLVVAHQGQGGVPDELDGGVKGLVVPAHLAGDFLDIIRQGGHLAVYPAEQGFQLLHAGDLRLLGLAQGIKSGVRRFQSVQVAFGHIIHVRQRVDHGLHRRHGLVLPGGSSLLGGLRFRLRRLRFLLRRLRGGVRLLTGVGSPHHLHSLGGIRRLLRPGRGGQHPDTQCQGQK